MHLPSLVQIGGISVCLSLIWEGYLIDKFVSISLRLDNLLKPTRGLSWNKCSQSGMLVKMFQFLWIILLIFGLLGL